MIPGRIPPHNLDAERAVLGAILLEGRDAMPRVAATLRPTDWYTDAHRLTYAAMLGLHERREPVDLITLTEELRRTDNLTVVGGPAALALLVEQASIAAHLDAYVTIVRDQAGLREIIQTSSSLITQAFDAKDDPQGMVEAAENTLRELRIRIMAGAAALAPSSLGDVLDQVVLDLQAGPPAGVIGMPFPSVNALLAGGFQPGELVLLGGYAGFGKTAMALEITTATAARGNAVNVVSREMLKEALARRILSQHAGVQAAALRSGDIDDSEWTLIRQVLPKLKGLPVWMTDRVATIAQIEAMVHAERERHDLKLLVVDYLQLIRGPRGMSDKRLEVEHISGALKQLAIDHQIVVLAISAMSRRERSAAGRRPTMSDLRESGRLEHDADIILLGWRPDQGKRETELIVAKGRGNRTGTVELLFFGGTLTFEEKSDREPGTDDVPF